MTTSLEPIQRMSVPALDEILGEPFKVLDDGFVRVVDYMGSDEAIVQAARVSYGAGTKKSSQDRGLIRYLLRHRHTTPFEMCELKLHVRVPMDCWRQWIRHRTANVNEYSTRYSLAIEGMQKTSKDQWRKQSTVNQQGSGGFFDVVFGEKLTDRETELQGLCREVYQERIDQGVSREQARKDLPLSTYTEAYWKVDLHNLLHFLALRMDSHAQYEIREFARTIGEEIVSRWVPMSWDAFMSYNVNKMQLSKLDQALIQKVAQGDADGARALAAEQRWTFTRDGEAKKSRELMELEEKIVSLGMVNPWAE